ncbi:MAG: FAD:protein FMN transferase [Propionibacteriaceae bacterium]|jgi:thiamine biosynthesis lipoprotein|nr:FAD:protein FMN transferase [Propionibacteriaceae bacterium]
MTTTQVSRREQPARSPRTIVRPDSRTLRGRTRSWRRWAASEELFGTVVTIQLVRGPEDERERFNAAVRSCWDELRLVEKRLSPVLETSDLRRLAAGTLKLARADKRVREVEALCHEAKAETGGLFDAWYAGDFDPSGLVKGWAVDQVAERYLHPLLKRLGASAVGISAGGDMRLFTAPTSVWRWRVGVADPAHPGGLLATLEIANGAVATSGVAERGNRIVDPRTGRPAESVASATVVADTLAAADRWATAAVVAGFDDLSWIEGAPTRSGLLIARDGRVRRWTGTTEL